MKNNEKKIRKHVTKLIVLSTFASVGVNGITVQAAENETNYTGGERTQARSLLNLSVIGSASLNAKLANQKQIDVEYALKYVLKLGLASGETTYITIDPKLASNIDTVQYRTKNNTWETASIDGNVIGIETSSILSLDLLGLIPDKVNLQLMLKNTPRNGTYAFSAMQKSSDLIDAKVITNSQAATSLTINQADTTAPDAPVVNPVTDKDTKVTGKGEAGSKVTVEAGGNTYTGTVGADGNFSVDIPKQQPGTTITVILTDDAGNKSQPTVVKVADTTAPDAPVVNQVTDKDTKVTGKGEAGSKVTVEAGENTYTGTVRADGSFSVDIPKQQPGTTITVILTDNAGNKSEPTVVKVTDATAPDAPVVNPVTDKDTKVTGKGEAGSKVTVEAGGNAYTGTVGTDGSFSVDIPKQQPGTTITVTLTDNVGNKSEPTVVKVADTTAPDAPVVNPVTDQDTKVTGKGEAGSKVTVEAGGNTYTGTVGADGRFSVDISKQQPGTTITVKLTDGSGNTSNSTVVIVKDVTAPDAPVLNPVTDQDTKVTGKGEAGSKVTVKVNGNTYTGKVGADGRFSVAVPKQQPGATITVTLTDGAGNTSAPSRVIVSATTANISANINKPLTTSHMYVTGNVTAGTERIALYVNGKLVRYSTIQPDGSYRAFIEAAYRVEGNDVTVVPLNKEGKAGTGDTTKIIKANYTRLPAPTIDPVNELNNYVTGKIDSRAKRVALFANNKFIRYGAVDPATGTYKVYIERNLVPIDGAIKVCAVDENNIDGYMAQTTMKAESVDIGAPDVTQYVYGDTHVKGKYAAGTKSIKLYINGKFIRYGALDTTNETFKIYVDKTLAPAGAELKIVPTTASGKEGQATTITVKGR